MSQRNVYKVVQNHLKDAYRTRVSLNSLYVNRCLVKRQYHSCISLTKGTSLCSYSRLDYMRSQQLHRLTQSSSQRQGTSPCNYNRLDQTSMHRQHYVANVTNNHELLSLRNSCNSDIVLKEDNCDNEILRQKKKLCCEQKPLGKTIMKGKQLFNNSNAVFTRRYHDYRHQRKGRDLCSHVLIRGLHDQGTMSKSNLPHTPVMLDQVLKILNPQPGQVFLDMTFGAGGHSREVLSVSPSTRVIALDRDPTAYHYALQLQEECRLSGGELLPLLGRFSDVGHLLTSHGYQTDSVDSVLFDVGVSSMQFDQPDRGFMLSQDGPLDMRMDGNRFPDKPSAADVVNLMTESELYHIIKKYGEERMARKIANMIVESRYAFGRINSTKQLADIISSVFDGEHKTDKMMRHAHVATKTFQALRIFVNNELNELNNGLELVHRFLKPGGTCLVLSFHSLEDRIVKRHFHGISVTEDGNQSVRDRYRNSRVVHEKGEVEKMMERRWEPLSRKLIVPRHVDCLENPRARSAKLRAAYKVKVSEKAS